MSAGSGVTAALWVGVRGLAACLLALHVTGGATALDPALEIAQYGHTAWAAADGWFAGDVLAITQTHDGYLWLGTGFGLLRFDGARFVPWEPPAGSSLPRMPFGKMLTASDGSLWIGGGGLARWRGGQLTNFPELDDVIVTDLLEDRNGTVWVGGITRPNASVCSIVSDTVRCDDAGGELGEWTRSLYEDSRGQLWVGAASGVWRWSPGPRQRYGDAEWGTATDMIEDDDGALLIAYSQDLRRLVDGRIEPAPLVDSGEPIQALRFLRDRDGGLWIGTANRGLLHAHRGRIDRFPRADGLSSDTPQQLYEDREGNVWAATGQGLDRFHALAVHTITARQGLPSDHVLAVLAARDGALWVAGRDGLSRFLDGRHSVYRAEHGLADGLVATLFEDSRGRIWVSTSAQQGLMWYSNERFVRSEAPGANPFCIAEDAAGDLWVADREVGLLHLDGDGRLLEQFAWSQLSDRVAMSMAVDPVRGGLWLGFIQGGLGYFEGGRLLELHETAAGLGAGQVRDVQVDAQGAVWAGTEDGLSRLGRDGIATLGRDEGLPCDRVHWMREDEDGAVWLYTACGLVSLSRAELDAWIADPTRQVTITALYDHTDGVECSWINSYYTPYAAFSGGRLYFTTRTGVGVLDPRRIHFNHVVPPVVIEQVTADGVTHDAASMPELPPLVRDLRIDYTALSLTAPRKVRFRYKLEGSDEGWQEAGTRRQAFYSDLAPGSYRFRVTACNDDGVWNEEDATLAFRVLPTFYQTKAFLLLSIAVGACAVWGTYHWRMRRVAARLAAQFDERLVERTRIAQELHDTLLQGFLGASMQLHLAVDRLPTDSPERSRMNHVLALMARVIDEGRNAVRGLRTPAAPGGDLEQAFSAIPGELELPEGVGFRVVGEGTARSLHAVVRDEVYRIGREAILNAFRHSDASSIEVEIAFARDQLCVRVRDDGRGIAPEVLDAGREGHFGLSGMRERAERIGGKLSLRSRVGDGTEVELVVPGRLVFTETE